MTRTCKKCGSEKDIEDFGFERGYRRHTCNACRYKQKAPWKAANQDKTRGYSKKWRDANPGKVRDINYRRYYGISLEEYERMYAEQDGRCLICGERFESLVVDHCHRTDVVRGLLCNPCNTAIGLLGEDGDRIERAASHVNRFSTLG